MRDVAVAVIGVGGMGSFHARTLASLAGVTVVAVSDPHEPNSSAMRDELGARVDGDPFALIDDDAIDGVVIASPDDTHAELAIRAVQRGLPTLCEKPLATNAGDARRVVDAEVAAGHRSIQLGYMREYDPAHRQLQHELVDLGRIDYVRAVHRNANQHPRPLDLIVGQSMVHDIHSVRYLTGDEITSVHASGAGPTNGSFRHVVALCTLAGGGHAVLEFDDGGFAYDVTVEVLADDGDVLTGPPTRAIRRRHGSIDVHLGTDWFGWFAEAYRIQDQAWIDSIRSGDPTGPTAWDGLAAQVVADAVVESLTNASTVAVELPDRPAIYG
jgi:myo-inositol 2-dehydrogenase/D-chiro-inositol 1-dehydrogenase